MCRSGCVGLLIWCGRWWYFVFYCVNSLIIVIDSGKKGHFVHIMIFQNEHLCTMKQKNYLFDLFLFFTSDGS